MLWQRLVLATEMKLLLILTQVLLLHRAVTQASNKFTKKTCDPEQASRSRTCGNGTCQMHNSGRTMCKCHASFFPVAEECYPMPRVTVKEPPNDPSEIKNGAKVLMMCESENVPAKESKWFLDNSTFTIGVDGTSLTIQKFSDMYAGTWQCQVAVEDTFSPRSARKQLRLEGRVPVLPGQPVSVPDPGDVKIGTDVILTCPVSSNVTYTYIWYSPNKMPTTRSGPLMINGFSFTDVGLYRCKAQNLGGVSLFSPPLMLTPNVKPTIQKTPDYSAFIKAGTDILLACVLDSLQKGTDVTYTWHLNQSKLLSVNAMTYGIKNFGATDAGTYTCQVTYDGTKSKMSDAIWLGIPELRVALQPLGPMYGERTRVVMTCDVSKAVPGQSVLYRWRREDEALTPPGAEGMLALPSFSLSRIGMYSCEIRVTGGWVRSDEVQLKYKYIKPALTAEATNPRAIPESSSVNLTCGETSALGYQWFKDGVRITGQNMAVFTIGSFTSDNTGDYTCKASFERGLPDSYPSDPVQLVLRGK
ncbi:hypothetical protein BaRGS_00028170 [Batillaria attramentaria]|uniref:Ig-like domain-containing protein n=1 Tax=Batillaria attramentaria TaxID=370345 RepID=A0ABD0K0G3_9CAEN